MDEIPEYLKVLFEVVQTSKDVSSMIADKLTESTDGSISLTAGEAQAVSSMLRMDANLISNLLEENQRITDQALELLNRIKQK